MILRRSRSRKDATTPVLCTGCGQLWPACAMNYDSIGLYRCRGCNPDPGRPHDGQSRVQRERSERYYRGSRGYRCAECGSKISRSGYDTGWANPLPTDVKLCETCIGPDPHHDWSMWSGFELVRM